MPGPRKYPSVPKSLEVCTRASSNGHGTSPSAVLPDRRECAQVNRPWKISQDLGATYFVRCCALVSHETTSPACKRLYKNLVAKETIS